MKLNDLMTKSLDENLKDMEVTSLKPVALDDGKLVKIIVEYTPKNAGPKF
ncbi:hypothetical protein [Clostridium butyricum]